jgi:hypothetical protein
MVPAYVLVLALIVAVVVIWWHVSTAEDPKIPSKIVAGGAMSIVGIAMIALWITKRSLLNRVMQRVVLALGVVVLLGGIYLISTGAIADYKGAPLVENIALSIVAGFAGVSLVAAQLDGGQQERAMAGLAERQIADSAQREAQLQSHHEDELARLQRELDNATQEIRDAQTAASGSEERYQTELQGERSAFRERVTALEQQLERERARNQELDNELQGSLQRQRSSAEQLQQLMSRGFNDEGFSERIRESVEQNQRLTRENERLEESNTRRQAQIVRLTELLSPQERIRSGGDAGQGTGSGGDAGQGTGSGRFRNVAGNVRENVQTALGGASRLAGSVRTLAARRLRTTPAQPNADELLDGTLEQPLLRNER